MIITDYSNPEYPNARVIDNFLTPEENKRIINKIKLLKESIWEKQNKNNEKMDDYNKMIWNDMSIAYSQHYNTPDMKMISNRLVKVLGEKFKSEIQLADTKITRWRKGRSQIPHIDFFHEEDDHDYQDMQNYGYTKEKSVEFGKLFDKYHFSSILYLNGHDEFEGGDLYFPQFNNFTIEPKPGRLAMFVGDTKHFHGVTEVTDGIRYTVASFYKDVNRKNNKV